MEVKAEAKTRVKECQGCGGAQHNEGRETNGRKWQEIAGKNHGVGGGGRGRTGEEGTEVHGVRQQGSDNKGGMVRGYIFKPGWIERVNRG